jgi:hypothetical protein
MSNHSVIRQDEEFFLDLVSIRIGAASLMASKPPGSLCFVFDDEKGKDRIELNWISSVVYLDEILCSQKNYPYFKFARGLGGLYECLGSSYVQRLQDETYLSGQTFSKHRHFVYWDSSFNWNITASSFTINGSEA